MIQGFLFVWNVENLQREKISHVHVEMMSYSLSWVIILCCFSKTHLFWRM